MEKLIATDPPLAYHLSGSGPVLVLLHGFCENKSIWYPAARGLGSKFSILIPDLPGFGSSGMPKETLSIDLMADEVKRILDHEKIRSCVMIGHSMGGYVSLAFAEKYPEMLKGFGLFHSSASADDEAKKANRQKTADFVKENGVAPFVRTLAPTLFSPQNAPDAESFKALLAMMEACSVEGVVGATLAMMNRPDRSAVLKAAKVPVLFAVGEQDQVIPEKAMLKQASETPIAFIELFKNSGHLGMLEEPEKTQEVLSKFAEHCFDK